MLKIHVILDSRLNSPFSVFGLCGKHLCAQSWCEMLQIKFRDQINVILESLIKLTFPCRVPI